MHWWVATMAVLYALSGITIVKSDEVAVILRWGRLVGATPRCRSTDPGLLFAFPRPMDSVVRVQVKHVWEVPVVLHCQMPRATRTPLKRSTLDPLTQGYALTGDQNIVQLVMVARYRVRSPAEWAFSGPSPKMCCASKSRLRWFVRWVRWAVDRVLSDGRKNLVATATRRAQAGLDAAHSGLELSSLELTASLPPRRSGQRFRCRAERVHWRGDKQERGAGFCGKRHPAGSCAIRTRGADRPRCRRCRSRDRARGDAQAFWHWIGNTGRTLWWFANGSTGMPWNGPFARLAEFVGYRRRSVALPGFTSRLRLACGANSRRINRHASSCASGAFRSAAKSRTRAASGKTRTMTTHE